MSNREELLSIGEVARLTGAGIQALRYYERKNILKPAYTDPESGYRYYSLDQIYYVVFIMNCVQFGIPLNNVADVFREGNMDAMEDFILQSVMAAQRKIQMLQTGLRGFDKALEKIKFGKEIQAGKIYTRELPERCYLLRESKGPLVGARLIRGMSESIREVYGDNLNRITEEDNIEALLALPEIGCLCKHSPEGVRYYGFSELAREDANEKTIIIPSGTYFFRHDEKSRIEEAGEIFKEQLRGRDSYMIIETQEALLSKSKLSQPMYELRLIV